MTSITDQYRLAEAPLRAVIEAVPADRWTSASPCEGWTARDVVRHMIDSQRDHFTRHDIALPEPPDVEADPAEAWRAHAAAVTALAGDDAVMSQAFEGHFGPTTVGETLQRFYIFDMVAHRWDIAQATGQDTEFTEEELDQMEAGMDGFGDALYMPGVAKPGVEPPEGATRQQSVLARLGRAA